MDRRFQQVDVFTVAPFQGNPVAVVLDGDGLSTEEMQQFAAWTNLSETTFVLPPTDAAASYRVRIFTPVAELPFAGHPTLGTAHAWLVAGDEAQRDGVIRQQCAAGLIDIRRTQDGLAFAAPPLVRSGPVEPALLDELADVLGLAGEEVIDSQWVDNGPGWVAVLVDDVDTVLRLRPRPTTHDIGVVAAYPTGSPFAVEVRAFFPKDGVMVEDPVTGSLNASLAEWLLRTGRVRAPYVAHQGRMLGRSGRVHVSVDDDGAIWVGGGTVTCVTGEVRI